MNRRRFLVTSLAGIDTLREHGWIDGQNLTLEWIVTDGNAAKLPLLARELVARNPDVIVAPGTTPIRAVRDATMTIPGSNYDGVLRSRSVSASRLRSCCKRIS